MQQVAWRLVELRPLTSARAYLSEQIGARAVRHSRVGLFHKCAETADVVVACDAQDKTVAYVLMEPNGHVDHLYCHSDHSRRGLVDRLLGAVERIVRDRSIGMLYAEASELARQAFALAGYVVDRGHDFRSKACPSAITR